MNIKTFAKLNKKELRSAMHAMKDALTDFVEIRWPEFDEEDKQTLVEFAYCDALGTVELMGDTMRVTP